MAKGAVQYLRDSEGGWQPAGVWFGTPGMLADRFLPGVLTDFAARNIEYAQPPVVAGGVVGTWEDWVSLYAPNALTNGHDLWCRVIPADQMEATVDLVFARHVLGLSGASLASYKPQGIANVKTQQVPDLTGPAAQA